MTISALNGARDRLATKPSVLPAIAEILPIFRPSAIAVISVSGDAFGGAHDLQQFHHVGRREEMRAGHVLRPFRHRGDLIDVQRRGVGEQERARLHHLVEFGEDRLLDVHFLEHRFDDDVAVLDVVVAGDRMDAGEAALHLLLLSGCRA